MKPTRNRDLFEPELPESGAPEEMILPNGTGGEIRIGTSGWSFDDWEGSFYPRGWPAGKRLDWYVRHFPCVEVNSTYYRIPHPAVMARLAEKVPPGFLFTVKANEGMTHRRSHDPALYRAFLECLEPLRRTGTFDGVVLQFPWAFRHGADAFEHLRRLRTELSGMPLWVEFRHAGWTSPDVLPFLRELDLGFVAVDEPQLPGLFPPIAERTNDAGYVRFHGRNAQNWWGKDGHDRYDWDYSRDELSEWVDRIRAIAARARRSYLFFNNCYMGRAVRSARLMKGLLASPAEG